MASDTPEFDDCRDPWLEYTVQCFRCGGAGCLECLMTGRRPRYFDEMKAAQSQIAALKADAERYRWLRNDAAKAGRHDPCVITGDIADHQETPDGEFLDAAIDAAMKAKP